MKYLPIIFGLILILFAVNSQASQWTATYNLEIPARGSTDVHATLSNDFISIDTILTILSNDTAAITDDTTTTVGGAVGRFKLVSDDGTSCYIQVYAPN